MRATNFLARAMRPVLIIFLGLRKIGLEFGAYSACLFHALAFPEGSDRDAI